jgi:hypothetical protein
MAKDKLKVHGVFDVGANAVAYVYNQGTAKDQKDAAEAQIERAQLHVGDNGERDLRVVEINEV